MNLRKYCSRFFSQYIQGAVVESDVDCRQGKGIFISSECSHQFWVALFYGYQGFVAWGKRLRLGNNCCYLVLQCMELCLATHVLTVCYCFRDRANFYIYCCRYSGSPHTSVCTGCFIMFSVITNIYNKNTKGPILMELFTATGKLKKFFFLTTRYVRCVHHGWHGTHRYDIQVLATHASPWWRVCVNNLNLCAVSLAVHTSNISSCQKKKSVFLWLWTIPLR